MERKVMIIVSDDDDFVVEAMAFSEEIGVTPKVFSPKDWTRQASVPGFAHTIVGENPPLSSGSAPVTDEGAKILHFPQNQNSGGHTHEHSGRTRSGRVQTMNQLESTAIQNAIRSFNGNLTEAAKALGIGRATLYRKVKLFNIDPAFARRNKKEAA